MRNLILLILLFCSFPSVSIYAFLNKDLHTLTMQDGLADNTVFYIFKDKDGFMWFATNNGVSRYDGKTIKNFSRHDVSYMYISQITDLSKSCLGFISNSVLYAFNRRTESFIPFKQKSGTQELQVTNILSAGEGRFWGVYGDKIILYSVQEVKDVNGCIIALNLKIEKQLSVTIEKGSNLTTLCYSKNHRNIYLVTNLGRLFRMDDKGMEIKSLSRLCEDDNLTIHSILDANGFIWITTIAHGIIRYHISSGVIDNLTYEGFGKQNMLSHTDVFQIIPIGGFSCYLAVTWNGYTILKFDKNDPKKLTTEIYNNASLNNRNLETRMLTAYYDPEGILWIGTNGGGVLYSDLRVQYYNQFHQERHNEICGITVDNDHYIWLATFHKGIMRSKEPLGSSSTIDFKQVETPESIKNQTTLCLLNDKEGNIWFGNKDGTLTFYNKQTKHLSNHTLIVNGKKINSAQIWALYVDSNHRFLIGTDKGLLLYDPLTNICNQPDVREDSGKKVTMSIRAIAETKDGGIWLGTSNIGLCRLLMKTEKHILYVTTGYEKRRQIGNIGVRSLLASMDGNLYVGYSDGFAILSPQKDMINEFYTTRDGLCSNFIGCIVEDYKGHIWLGSNSGISRYSRHQRLFYNYYISGSNRSAFSFKKMLFWGNNKSLTYFNPEHVDAYQVDNKVLITGLAVSDHVTSIGDKVNGQIILNKSISFTDSITLSNANRDFSLTFNNLSYSEEQQKYNYRLLPYQKHWLVSNGGEKASYTNLPEGEYVFEVRSIYPDGHLGSITDLKVSILPHWSHTFLFRFFVFILLVGIVVLLIRYFNKRKSRLKHEMRMQQELLVLKFEREKEHLVRTERENFFTNAAHELRTPLTLVLSPLQELLQQTEQTEPAYNKLLTMYRNGTSLHSLVDQLLYVQKIEAGMIKLRLSKVDIVGLMKDIMDSFRSMAETKGFHLEEKLLTSPLYLWIDVEKIVSSVKNLLSNAFKYTLSGGTVLVVVSETKADGKDYCTITVSDTGVGIPEKLQGRVFESFITGDNTPFYSTKVGIGLRIVKNTMDLHHGRVILQSVVGEGSRFDLYIPEGKAHFVGDSYVIVNDSEEKVCKHQEMPLNQFVSVDEQSRVPLTKKKILVIEDNESIRKYVCSLFTSKYILYEAENGEEGVAKALKQLPDLIICDIMMPIMDGFACCREIRVQSETAHIPFLMLTAKAEEIDILDSTRCGADDYMMKPFNPELLKAKVEHLILERERLKRIYTKALMLKRDLDSGTKEDIFMRQVIGVVEANLSDVNFSVKLLAENLNMSQPTLYRKMKQHTDLTVIDIIRSVRVSKAASLIMENRYSIQEISELVGFSDTRTLRKHFTEHFGVSPSRYGSNQMEGE